jgi:adenylate cyclase
MGIASGPLVAGVIGRRKFHYDLWGDTVNLASRLEYHGESGQILVSEAVADQTADDFLFTPSTVIEIKGKGPTSVRFLLGRKADATTPQPAAKTTATVS